MNIRIELNGKVYIGVVTEQGGQIPPPDIPPVTPPPVITPPPISGELGSKTNPVRLVDTIPGLNYYGFDVTTREYYIPPGGTVWFLADPLLVPAFSTAPPRLFKLQQLNYLGQTHDEVMGKVYKVDKASLVETWTIDLIGAQTGYTDFAYSPTIYYLIALINSDVLNGYNMTLRWKGVI